LQAAAGWPTLGAVRVLIAGCGYVGSALGARLVADGHAVAGIRRPGSDAAPLRRVGILPLAADLGRPESLALLPADWDWVVHCAAPSIAGEEAYRVVYLDGARNLVDWLRPRPPRAFVFISSTSVYGQTDGSAVDETSPAEPDAATGRVLREAEAFLVAAAAGGFPAMVLRAAGIYGPGRNRLEALVRGDVKLSGTGSRWVNLIHRDDLGGAIVAALERGRPGAIYNVADASAATEGEYYGWLAQELGVPLPPRVGPGEITGRGRRATHKRVVAGRLRQETGWAPAYPDFRAGYTAELTEWRKARSAAGTGAARKAAPSAGGTGAAGSS
jgi:nucleoside-diphosphate-sugar epimerase